MNSVAIGLGSNLGDRERYLESALGALASRGFELTARSSFYWTEPVDAPPQDWFLNAAVVGHTLLTPHALLAECLAIERALGRVRRIHHGPRTLDLDLLLFGDLILHDSGLTLPHPGLQERRFVLVPLNEIAPELRHPGLGQSVAELLERCPDTAQVQRAQPARA